MGKHVWFNPKKPHSDYRGSEAGETVWLDMDSKMAVYFAQKQTGGERRLPGGQDDCGPRRPRGGCDSRDSFGRAGRNLVWDVRTMDQRVHDSLARQRFATTMLGAFSLFALLLSTVGVYGVISYLVSQSKHDLGIRIALGAQPANIVGLVVRQGMELTAVGVVAGLVGAVAVTRVMASLLFGVTATDTLTFGTVAGLLAGAALFATVIPARRATRVDPMTVLRED